MKVRVTDKYEEQKIALKRVPKYVIELYIKQKQSKILLLYEQDRIFKLV